MKKPLSRRATLGSMLLVAGLVLGGLALHLYDIGSPGDPQYPAQPGDYSSEGSIGLTVRSPGLVRAEYTFTNRGLDYRDVTMQVAPDAPNTAVRDLDHGEHNGDTVAAFRMYGRARIDPMSVKELMNPDIYRLDVKEEGDSQEIFVYLDSKSGQAYYPGFGDSFVVSARLRSPLSATQGSRTVLVTPRIAPISLCPVPSLGEIRKNHADKYALSAARESCSEPDSVDPHPDRDHWVNVSEPESFKIDYSNFSTRTPGLLSWTVDRNLSKTIGTESTSFVVNYVRINQEAINSRYLFLSAAFLGFAAALVPIGFELLTTSQLQILRRIHLASGSLSRTGLAAASRRGDARRRPTRPRKRTTSAPRGRQPLRTVFWGRSRL